MSLASVYAANYAAGMVSSYQAPAPFVGANGRAEVTVDGNLRLVPTNPGSDFVIAPAAALAFATWLTTNFT